MIVKATSNSIIDGVDTFYAGSLIFLYFDSLLDWFGIAPNPSSSLG